MLSLQMFYFLGLTYNHFFKLIIIRCGKQYHKKMSLDSITIISFWYIYIYNLFKTKK